jgi:hypothetical protein
MQGFHLKKDFAQAMGFHALAALITLVPLFVLNHAVFFGNTDALFYSTILKLVASHMAGGDFLPSWVPEANGGTGSPVMYYYSLLSYQITALLGAPLAPFDPLGDKRLVLGMFFAQWCGGMLAWLWLKRRFSAVPAMIASLLFTLFPYKWIYIYLHINLAQLWALAWLPPLMMAAEDMIRGRKSATIWYGIALALIALTHPPTLVAFGAIPALYVLIFSPSALRALGPLLKAHALALLLSAYYLLPVLLNFDLVQAGSSNIGRMNYAENLSHRDLMYNFHYLVIAMLLLGMLLRLYDFRHSRAGQELWFWLGALLTVLLLCLKVSQPLWDALPALQFLRFPVARFHAVALIGGSVLCALFFQLHSQKQLLPNIYSPRVLLAAIIGMSVATLYYVEKTYSLPNAIDWPYIERMHALNIILPQEYLTRWQPQDTGSLDHIDAIAKEPLAEIVKGSGKIDAVMEENKRIVITGEIKSKTATIGLRQLYWPYWGLSDVAPQPGKEGLITFQLARGKYNTVLRLSPMPGQSWGRLISLMAWLSALLVLYRCRRLERNLVVQ